MRTIFTALLLIGLVAGGAAYYRDRFAADHTANFRTTEVKRGDLLITIGATGTLEPEEVVDVGAQVAGRIKELGKDPRGATDPAFKDKDVDYCSPVHEKMLLAQIDKSLYQATRDSAAANLAHDQADLAELQAKRDQTEAEWVRAQKLRELKFNNLSSTLGSNAPDTTMPIKGISDSDYITAKANFEVAAAYLEEGKATVLQDTATLSSAQTNLDYTTINSPVEGGTIIDRRVNVGQTVVASLNAPSLFLIAKDLRQMQVWASVNEADIGRLKVGTPVRFTVDAYPEDEFRGEVFQIRLNATMTQNVVTYTVVVNTKNDDLRLLPYLTADVKFEVERRNNVLLVPNGALRWQPQPPQIVPELRATVLAASAQASKGHEKAGSEGPAALKSAAGSDTKGGKNAKDGKDAKDAKPVKTRKKRDNRGMMWVQDGEFVRPIEVRIGATDGTNTEVTGADVKENLEIVLGEIRSDRATDTGTNPFAPKLFKGKTANPNAAQNQNSGGK